MSASVWTPLHARLHQTLRQRQLLPCGVKLLVAVSGGQDSLCLLRLLMDLQPKWNWQLQVAHCNHRWRSDSDANAVHVAALCHQWGLPCHQTIASEIPASEAAARHWRYQVLTDLARSQGCVAVVTGHTASDRAETLLFNLLRGSGMDGLQALSWQRELAPGLLLVRPLLEVMRSETAQFCQAANLPVWEDSTNDDRTYARNRIRQELLPYLATFNPQVETTLAQTVDLLQADVNYLEEAARSLAAEAIVSPQANSPWKLNRSLLKTAPLALQRRVVRHLLLQILPEAPTFDHIEKLVRLITAPNRSQTDPLPGGSTAIVHQDWIEIKPNSLTG